MIITVASKKGGVGKTTISTLFACTFAKAGKKVLMIDYDPQQNLKAFLENVKKRKKSENKVPRQT